MPEITPDATPRLPKNESAANEIASLEAAWIRDYFAAQIEDLHRLSTEREIRYEQRFVSQETTVREKAETLRTSVEAAASALAIQTASTDRGLMDHIEAQEKSTRLAQESLKEILAEKDKAVNMAATNAAMAQQEFKDSMMTRLDILNGHKVEIGTLTATFAAKDQVTAIRDQVLIIETRQAENTREISSLATNPVDQTTIRLRIEALEMRPVALSPEEQGKFLTQIAELKTETQSLRTNEHDLRNKFQMVKDRPGALLQPEIDDIRRLLRLAIKADVGEPLTGLEVADVRTVLSRNSVRGRRLTTWETALISAFSFALIAAIVTFITHFH